MLSGIRSTISNWKDDFVEKHGPWIEVQWNYYKNERAVIKGLPVAIISSVGAAYMYSLPLKTGILFASVHYITFTALIETVRNYREIDPKMGLFMTVVWGVVTKSLMKTMFKISLNYPATLVLGAAAFTGQLSRSYLIED